MREYKRRNPEVVSAAAERWRERWPEKAAAHRAVALAIARGDLVPQPCGVDGCDTGDQVQAHHPDYSKPLEVEWLCVTHHHEEHVRLRALEGSVEAA